MLGPPSTEDSIFAFRSPTPAYDRIRSGTELNLANRNHRVVVHAGGRRDEERRRNVLIIFLGAGSDFQPRQEFLITGMPVFQIDRPASVPLNRRVTDER